MAAVITSLLPFAPVSWWALAAQTDEVLFDLAEHFQKMSYRNRYHITGSNGLIKLTIPLMGGREQRLPMQQVAIDNSVRWQVQHWRTIVSVYARSPYFEFYQPSLQPLFEQPFTSLATFNLATMHWVKKQLKCLFDEVLVSEYKKDVPEADLDVRRYFRPAEEARVTVAFPPYYQLFEERNGFLPNLSILDLLFSLGPDTLRWLGKNKEVLQQRVGEIRRA